MMKRWDFVLALLIVTGSAYLTYMWVYAIPYPRWQKGEQVCLKQTGAKALVSNTFRYAYGVTYYLTAVDGLNRVYEVAVQEEALQVCQ